MDHPLALVIIAAQFAASISILIGATTAFAQSKVAVAAIENIARQPEARGPITTTLFIGAGVCETAGVYGFVFAILLVFANPLINNNIENLMRAVGY